MKNDYEIRGDITAIIINSPKYGRKESLINTNKLDVVKDFPNSWCLKFKKTEKMFYVQGSAPVVNGKQKTVVFHRWITNAPDGMEVDHKNHDGLINLDDNLRICTHAENKQNLKGSYKNSKSGIRGVVWNKCSRKWQAHIKINGKQIHLGLFDDIIEAEKVVVKARSEKMPYSNEGVNT